MRSGPHPLPVHLGMIAANMSGIHNYASSFSHSISEHDAVQMMRGIQMYQKHPFIPEELPTRTIWSEGGVSIKAPVLKAEHKYISDTPLLLVPSLINKANILDISEERSMLRWFNQMGIETYLLDWGDFTQDAEGNIDINALIGEVLCNAIQSVAEIHGGPIDVLGYCMGGTLLLPAYCLAPDHIRRMTLLATPWDFKTKPSPLARNVRIWSPQIMPVIEGGGCLPSEWVAALFASLDPNGSAQKFIRFASMDQSSVGAKLFVAVEDWLNNGVDIPAKIAQHCIQEWFIGNKLSEGNLHIGGKHINTTEIDADILIVASKSDRLVPFKCAANIQKNLGSASFDIIELDCGHVGLIVGSKTIETVWQPIFDWHMN